MCMYAFSSPIAARTFLDSRMRLAARLVEVEAREKRAAQLEASAAEHEAKAKAIHKAAEEKWARFTA